MSGGERPFKLFGRHERAALRQVIDERCRDWAARWLPAGLATRLDCAPCAEIAATLAHGVEGWIAFADRGGDWWALAGRRGTVDALATAVLGGAAGSREPASALAARVAHDALAGLAAALLGGEAVTPAQVEPQPFQPGGASFGATLVLGDALTLALVSSPSWTARALKARLAAPAAVAPVDALAAFAAQPVEVEVVAGGAEVALRELLGLRAGHVIALDTRVEQPLAVRAGPRKAPWCEAHLGMQEGHRAVALKPRR